jgi:hypothetical protein
LTIFGGGTELGWPLNPSADATFANATEMNIAMIADFKVFICLSFKLFDILIN